MGRGLNVRYILLYTPYTVPIRYAFSWTYYLFMYYNIMYCRYWIKVQFLPKPNACSCSVNNAHWLYYHHNANTRTRKQSRYLKIYYSTPPYIFARYRYTLICPHDIVHLSVFIQILWAHHTVITCGTPMDHAV